MVNIDVKGNGSVIVIALKGEFFLGNIQQVEATWDEQTAKNPEVIAINCSELSFVDSSAIGSMVKFLNYSSQNNIKLLFVDVSDSIAKVFEKARLNRIFTIVSKEKFEQDYKE